MRRVLTVAHFTFRALIRRNLLIVWVVSVHCIGGLSTRRSAQSVDVDGYLVENRVRASLRR